MSKEHKMKIGGTILAYHGRFSQSNDWFEFQYPQKSPWGEDFIYANVYSLGEIKCLNKEFGFIKAFEKKSWGMEKILRQS